MGRVARFLAVALIVTVSVVVPTSAQAAGAKPPPVVDIPGTSSQIIKMAPTWNDVKAAQVWRAMIDMATKPGQSLATVPKPITAPKPVARPGAGGLPGAVLSSFMGGWAIGQGGLSLYGAITGRDQNKLQCDDAPDWFNAVNNFLTMGLASNCTSVVQNPNADIEAFTTVTLNGYSIGSPTWNGDYPSGIGSWCYKVNFTQSRNYIEGSDPRIYPQVQAIGKDGKTLWMNVAMTGTTAREKCPGGGMWSAVHPDLYPKPYPVQGPFIVGLSKTSYVDPNAKPDAVATIRNTDPIRRASCKIKWRDGTTTTADGDDYQETTGMPMTSKGFGCEKAYVSKPGAGPDLLPEEITVESTDTETGTKSVISDAPVPAFSPTEVAPLKPGNGRGLVLEKVVNGTPMSCMTWDADCSSWWSKTASGTQPSTDTGTYRCTYGGEALPLPECGPYRNTFDTQTDKPTITDPASGEKVEWTTKPNMNSTNPGAGINPGGQCLDEWSSVANPIEWILQPIKCALVWAFVPRSTEIDKANDAIENKFKNSTPGVLAASFASLGAAFEVGATSCNGLPFELKGPGWQFNTRLFAACDEPMAGVAAAVKGILIFVTLAGGALACLRYVAAIVGYSRFGGDDNSSGGVRFKSS